ncbi:anti-sigma factor [Mesorhizobium sp. ZC-5]|uniref:anti-sigma factor n=1 Tax=Mesorhizobium sp. ZC-5 TaxID=2986066 RepID=UPI0021E91C96|nr:anti-sigma factor [Mesorhizobium sp. ZC-5]MCV3242449.1 anti-sigma factor [Mesorhizobium sp. ZC-5]
MSESDPKMSRRDEMEALLPFYLNGTLGGENLAAVEAWLAEDPAAAAALEEAEAELFGSSAANEAIRPPADALGRFSKMLDREAGPARETATGSRLAALWSRVAGLPSGLAWATAAAAIALVLLQAAVNIGGRGDGYEIAGSEDDLKAMPFALVVFKPDARMADIADFLDANDAVIAGGPTAAGVFRIGIPARTVADYDRVLGLISAAPFAQSVTAGKKPADGG